MDLFEGIYARRSIRRYRDKPIRREVIDDLIRAAMAAPSAGGEQPWHFVVIEQRETLNAIPEYHEYSAMLRGAAAAIVVCGDEALEVYKGFWVQDCSAATQNLLLAAYGNGLGAVWLGVHPVAERVTKTQELLKLPPSVIPLAIVALGYPAERKGRAERYDESRIHWEMW